MRDRGLGGEAVLGGGFVVISRQVSARLDNHRAGIALCRIAGNLADGIAAGLERIGSRSMGVANVETGDLHHGPG